MSMVLKSGQINYQSEYSDKGYNCVVIRDGVFHNLSEKQRLDLIKRLEDLAPKIKEIVDLDDLI